MIYNNHWGDMIAFSEFCTLDVRQKDKNESKGEGILNIKHVFRNCNDVMHFLKGGKINSYPISHRSGIWPKPSRNKRYSGKAHTL